MTLTNNFATEVSWSVSLYPVYTIKQTSSNHRANIQQMHSKYTCTTCALIARCLMIAWSCKRGISVFWSRQCLRSWRRPSFI